MNHYIQQQIINIIYNHIHHNKTDDNKNNNINHQLQYNIQKLVLLIIIKFNYLKTLIVVRVLKITLNLILLQYQIMNLITIV